MERKADTPLGGTAGVNPFVHLFFSYAALAVCVAFVPPVPAMRLGAFGAVLSYAVFGLLRLDRCQVPQVWLDLFVEWVIGVLLYANYFLVLMSATPPSTSTLLERFSWAVDLVANPRGVGTAWQIKNLPSISRDPGYVPSRYNFIIRRVARCLIFYIMLKGFGEVDNLVFWSNLRDGDFDEVNQTIIRRVGDVSVRELFIRLWLPLNTFLPVWFRFEYLHCAFSIVAVVLGDEPSRWPPMFGDVREAYSLRQFWGVFWQGLLRAAFLRNSSFIVRSVFCVPKGSSVYRSAVTVVAFSLTAVLHTAGFWAVGPACDPMHVMKWNILMGLAVVFEDLVKMAASLAGGGQQNEKRGANLWQRIFGYIWVWTYLAWSLPKIRYPAFDCQFEHEEGGKCFS